MNSNLRPSLASWMSGRETSCHKTFICPVNHPRFLPEQCRRDILKNRLISRKVHPLTTERLQMFRAEITRRGLTGFIVPHADEYQNEYVPACAERLAWLTGFTGSAGTAIVLAGQAAIFVDGRYTLQVRSQVDVQAWTPRHLMDEPVHSWLPSVLRGATTWAMIRGCIRRKKLNN